MAETWRTESRYGDGTTEKVKEDGVLRKGHDWRGVIECRSDRCRSRNVEVEGKRVIDTTENTRLSSPLLDSVWGRLRILYMRDQEMSFSDDRGKDFQDLGRQREVPGWLVRTLDRRRVRGKKVEYLFECSVGKLLL